VDCDQIGWKSIARTTLSIFVVQNSNAIPPTPRSIWGNFVETGGGVGGSGVGEVLEHKSGNISEKLKRVKIEEKLLWRIG